MLVNRRDFLRTGATTLASASVLGAGGLLFPDAACAAIESTHTFGTFSDEVLTPYSYNSNSPLTLPDNFSILRAHDDRSTLLLNSGPTRIAADDIANQFFAFYLTDVNQVSTVLESTYVEPSIITNEENPDVA